MHVRKHSLRFSCIFLSLILCLLIFSGKLIFIQFSRSSHLSSLAKRQQKHYVKLEPVRGTIYDRRLRPLALNVSAYSLYANPRRMTPDDKLKAAARLSGLLSIEKDFIQRKLDKDKYFVWLARKLPGDLAGKVKSLKIGGLGFIKESKRYYPNQDLAAHLIGFAGMDNQGLEGLELLFDKYLKGKHGWSHVLRDARQRELRMEKDFIPPEHGFSLILTIDETIQFIAERALEKAFKQHKAKAASIIVMDPKTGEILALANRPTYNLDESSSSPVANRTNRAVAYVYEPGSVFKIVTAAAALEEGIFKETDKIFCEKGRYRVGNRTLHDHHPYGTLTFREVIEKSSNIGTTKIAQKLGAARLYEYARRFRFAQRTGIDLIGEVPGFLRPPSEWSRVSISAVPIGHEISVTPLQLVCAISAIANDGVYLRPFVVKYIKDSKDELIASFKPRVAGRVISEDTAKRVQAILTGVVETGTGRRARIKGVSVAGKTGTAQKVVDGKHSHSQFYASFIGFAPTENPRLAVVVVLDEPRPRYYGGTVAAPVFREVIRDVLKYLETSTDASDDNG